MWDIGEASVVSRSLVKEMWRERPWNEDVRVCEGNADVDEGSSVVLDAAVIWMLSGRLRRGGTGGVAVWRSDLDRVGRVEEDVMDSAVSFVSLRSGWVGGAGRWDETSGVVIKEFPGRVGSLVGSGGRKGVGIYEDWVFKLALATWSMDGRELEVDDGELGVRRRGSGGAGHVSSDPDERLSSPLRNCFVGLRLRGLLLAEEPDDVVLSTCRTRARSSCSSTRFKF